MTAKTHKAVAAPADSELSKEMFAEWCQHPVTKVLAVSVAAIIAGRIVSHLVFQSGMHMLGYHDEAREV